MAEEVTERHESYGLITMSRINSQNIPLFGSSILHSAAVMIEISEARVERHLSRDWTFQEGIVFRGLLSPSQFAEATTQLNHGTGTPITLEYVAGDPTSQREQPPAPNKREQFQQEINRSLENVLERLQELRDSLKTKRDQAKVDGIIQQMRSNVPFVESQFATQMEKTVTEAKAEIEAMMQQRVNLAGEQAIRENQPRLELEGRQEPPHEEEEL